MTRQFNPSARLLLVLAMLGWAAPVLGQGQPPTQPTPQPAAKTAQAPAAKPSGPPAARKAKARKRRAMKPAVKRARKPVEAPSPAVAAAVPEAMRRDPFRPLVSEGKPGVAQTNLPPGKAGLVISSLRVEGSVRAPSGMIAVVANPQERVYFLRERDQLYDGIVEKITLDEVYFRENTRDAFGRPLERAVVKRIYSGADEQSGELR